MKEIVSQEEITKLLDEDRLRKRVPAASRNLGSQIKNSQLDKKEAVKTVPENNIEKTVHRINMLRDRMKDTSGYLSLYYDLKEAEGQFMREVEILERKGFSVSEQTLKRVKAMKDRIMKNKP